MKYIALLFTICFLFISPCNAGVLFKELPFAISFHGLPLFIISMTCLMYYIMLTLRNNYKIFNSIIGLNFIKMMNYFSRIKCSTKMFFHNKPMLSYPKPFSFACSSIKNLNNNISKFIKSFTSNRNIFNASIFHIDNFTFTRTGYNSFILRRFNYKFFPTNYTNFFNFTSRSAHVLIISCLLILCNASNGYASNIKSSGNLYLEMSKNVNGGQTFGIPVLEWNIIQSPMMLDLEFRNNFTSPRGNIKSFPNHLSSRASVHLGYKSQAGTWITFSLGAEYTYAGNDFGLPEGASLFNELRYGIEF